MKNSRYLGLTISIVIFSCTLSGCSNNYNSTAPVTSRPAYPRVIERAKKDKLYFILSSGVNIYSVTSVEIDKAKQNMIVHLDKVDSLRLRDVTTPGSTPKNGEGAAPSKIRVYMRDSTSYTLDEPHTIALDKVARIELD